MLTSSLQSEIQSLLAALVAGERERGLQVAAYHHGKLVVDAFAGSLSPDGPPVNADTLFPIFSTGKGVTATLIHLLAERGKLSYEDPLAWHWPAFGQNGKESITVRQALNHTSGLAKMPADVSYADFHIWNAMCRWLETAAPQTPPGAELEYHAVTYGWILGELAQRIDGRPFVQMIKEEICQPLGITGLYFGIPDDVESRVATIEEPPPVPAAASDAKLAAIPDCIIPVGLWMNDLVARRACIPASNGIMNARALARHYAALLAGGVDGIELLPPERIQAATQMQRPANHPNSETRQGLGYVTGNTGNIFGRCLTAFGHQGYGGSRGFADPATGLAVAFARNRFHDADSANEILEAITSAFT